MVHRITQYDFSVARSQSDVVNGTPRNTVNEIEWGAAYIAFHACRKREIESRSAHLRTPLAIRKDIREKMVITYTTGTPEYIHTKVAAVAQRGIKHQRGRTVLIKNVRAVLKNTMVTSSFQRSSEILKGFYLLAAKMSNYPTFIPAFIMRYKHALLRNAWLQLVNLSMSHLVIF